MVFKKNKNPVIYFFNSNPMKKYTIYRLVQSACVLLLLFACSHLKSKVDENYSLELLGTSGPSAKHVVILPFTNNTSRKGLEADVRKSFYSHFSAKRYYDFELHEIDTSLSVMEKQYSKPWGLVTPQELGRFFNADFLVYGEVCDYNKTYLVLYSQIALTIKVKMVETRTGKTAWTKTVVKRAHQGDFPLNPISAFSTSVRCGLHMQDEKTDDLIDRTCRNIVAEIPEPQPSGIQISLIDVQIGSFSEKRRAERLVADLKKKGFSSRIENIYLHKKNWCRVLLGPYRFSDAVSTKQHFMLKTKLTPILIHHPPAPDIDVKQ